MNRTSEKIEKLDFQGLELSRKKLPTPGTFAKKTSNVWNFFKTCFTSFFWLLRGSADPCHLVWQVNKLSEKIDFKGLELLRNKLRNRSRRAHL